MLLELRSMKWRIQTVLVAKGSYSWWLGVLSKEAMEWKMFCALCPSYLQESNALFQRIDAKFPSRFLTQLHQQAIDSQLNHCVAQWNRHLNSQQTLCRRCCKWFENVRGNRSRQLQAPLHRTDPPLIISEDSFTAWTRTSLNLISSSHLTSID